jgi:hypothetical protein
LLTKVSDATGIGQAFSPELQGEVDELYLYNNSIQKFGSSQNDLAALTNLKVLNLRYNEIKVVNKLQFAKNTQLVELIIEDNLIAKLEPETFLTQSLLELLRIGNNLITELPEALFAGTPNLKILRLENNQLTDLPANVFDFQQGCTTTCLEELHLQRNFLTELREGIFAPLLGIKRLFLQVNPELKLVPKSIFAAATAPSTTLESMSMLGSASACVKGTKAEPTRCTCALGYVDGDVNGNNEGLYCEPVICPAEIPGLRDKESGTQGVGLATCEGEYLDTCEATCETGYVGEATYTCQPKANSQEGEWVADPELTCTAVSCDALIQAEAFGDDTRHQELADADEDDLGGLNRQKKGFFDTCKGDQLKYNGAECTVECRDGYVKQEGTSSEFTCSAESKWISAKEGNFLVCEPVDCGSLVKQLKADRFEYVDINNETADSCQGGTDYEKKCNIRCATGYREVEDAAIKSFVCGKTANWEGALDCRGKRCGRTAEIKNNSIARCLGDVSFGGDLCGVSCENGFKPSGVYKFTTQSYCKKYQATCPDTFGDEFGIKENDDDSAPISLCAFEAEKQTLGEDGDPEVANVDTIECRISHLEGEKDVAVATTAEPGLEGGDSGSGDKVETDRDDRRCQKARLNKNTQCTTRVCRDGSVECLTCGSDGEWSESNLKCQSVVCPSGPETDLTISGYAAIKEGSCDSADTFTEKARNDCLAKFDNFADPETGKCVGTNKFDQACPVSCKFGYNPKNVPFRCDADQLSNGVWVGEIDCAPVVCPIVPTEFDGDGYASLEEVDEFAIITSLKQDQECEEAGKAARVYGDSLTGNGGGSGTSGDQSTVADVEIAGECVSTAIYDPIKPAQIQARCTNGNIVETYTLKCQDPSWAVTSVNSGPLKDSDRPLFPWQLTGGRFCRQDCGDYLGFSVDRDENDCEGTGEGDTCRGICKIDDRESVMLVCDHETQTWIPFNTTERNRCEDLFSTTSTTTTTAIASASGSLSPGAQAAVIVVPLFIILTIVMIVLYYFGFLKCLGLQPLQAKHEIYGQLYGEMYGQGAGSAGGMEIYAAAVEQRKVNKAAARERINAGGGGIKGRAGGGGNKAAPRPQSIKKVTAKGPGIKGRAKKGGNAEQGDTIGMEYNPHFKPSGGAAVAGRSAIAGRAKAGGMMVTAFD